MFMSYIGVMKDIKVNIQNNDGVHLRANITQTQKLEARKIAKSKGMTFQGWLGQIIEREIANQEATHGTGDAR